MVDLKAFFKVSFTRVNSRAIFVVPLGFFFAEGAVPQISVFLLCCLIVAITSFALNEILDVLRLEDNKESRSDDAVEPAEVYRRLFVVSDTEAEAYGGGFLPSVFVLVGGVHQYLAGQKFL